MISRFNRRKRLRYTAPLNSYVRASAVSFAVLALGCGPGAGGGAAIEPPSEGSSDANPTPPSGVEQATEDPPSDQSAAGIPCGELGCVSFEQAEVAFDAVLARSPRVLAVGEAHKLKEAGDVRSTADRFMNDLLPKLKGRASDLVVELWVVDQKCKKEVVAQVKQQQAPVVQNQSAQNQNEYVALGHASKALGIVPHILRPGCDEYDRIAEAGPDGILIQLAMIARLSDESIRAHLDRNGPTGPMVLAYGGAMHNDVAPKEGREDWSFGPGLQSFTQNRYIELDLIVPEFIKDNDTWRALPWYAHYDVARDGDRAVLFQPHPGSYVLIFPRSQSAGQP